MIHTSLLQLQRENLHLTGGICISNVDYAYLQDNRQQFLHIEEIEYFNSLQFNKRQRSYLQGRYCAKKALQVLLPQSQPQHICIKNGVFSQPVVQQAYVSGLQISLSHCDDLAASLAFSEQHPMGIDIETILGENMASLQTQCQPYELELLKQLALPMEVQLTLLWTVKEALAKILKCGLTISFALLEIEKLVWQPSLVFCYFKNFYQYKSMSFLLGNSVCSIVYPRKTQLTLDVEAIQKCFGI